MKKFLIDNLTIIILLVLMAIALVRSDKSPNIENLDILNKNIEIYLIQSGMWPAGEPLPEWVPK